MRIHLKSLGCRLNEAELNQWRSEFAQKGMIPVDSPEQAELLIINSCAVTQEAVKKSKRLLKQAQKKHPHARLVLTGCYAGLNESMLEGVDLLIQNQDKDQLVKKTIDYFNIPERPPIEHPLLPAHRQRAFIKVQDGCRYRCTYCVVTLLRGKEKSRPISAIVEQVNRLSQNGILEIVLTGVHLGGYRQNNQNLVDLIRALLQYTDMPRIRLGSLEPWAIQDDFWPLFDYDRLMPHLHLPVQSGSDTVLKRMARRGRRADLIRLMNTAYSAIPDLNLTTDIIVGFPGETEYEWQETLEFVHQIGFGHLHIFSYSPREGTKAARLAHPVPESIKKQRSQQLHQIADLIKQKAWQKREGKIYPVLVESDHSGYTPNYFKVQLPESSPVNQILMVKIKNGQAHPIDAIEHIIP